MQVIGGSDLPLDQVEHLLGLVVIELVHYGLHLMQPICVLAAQLGQAGISGPQAQGQGVASACMQGACGQARGRVGRLGGMWAG